MTRRLLPGVRLVVATHNPGKLAELRDLLAPRGIEAVSAGELGLPEPADRGPDQQRLPAGQVRPLGRRHGHALDQPAGDRRLLGRPEFKAMFLDDLLNGSRKQLAAPFADIVVFARDWGFRLEDIKVPVRWWHGDADHIVPYAHGQHAVAALGEQRVRHGGRPWCRGWWTPPGRLPDAESAGGPSSTAPVRRGRVRRGPG